MGAGGGVGGGAVGRGGTCTANRPCHSLCSCCVFLGSVTVPFTVHLLPCTVPCYFVASRRYSGCLPNVWHSGYAKRVFSFVTAAQYCWKYLKSRNCRYDVP